MTGSMPRFFRATPVAALIAACGATALLTPAALGQSVAREWNGQLLDAIRLDRPRPPIHARNLYHTSAAMYDAWAAYDDIADQVFHHERATAADVDAARREAISYAAYRMISHRYQNAVGHQTTLVRVIMQMLELGYDPLFTSLQGDSPAALGNRIAATIIAMGGADGANEAADYAANNGYEPVNEPLIFALPGTTMVDPNRWQALAFDYYVKQNGIPVGQATQTFVCPHWAGVTPFALPYRDDPSRPYLDPGPPPWLGTETDAEFKDQFVDVVRFSSLMDPTQGVMINVSPGVYFNNPLGENTGTGYPLNPVTGLPYTDNWVNQADYGRVVAEFWADGPASETPPGHWNTVANDVTESPLLEKRIGGTGDVLDDLEWDVKLYLALNGGEHDAAVQCWGVKGQYDFVRPISAIRYMAQNGQSSDPDGPFFNPEGMPIVPGLVEVITDESSAPGQRHEDLAAFVGEIAVYAWLGQPADPDNEIGGVGWQRGVNWATYQASTFVTPPFAAYTSGHSTYSRTGATVMSMFTGDEYFPGGEGGYVIPAGWLGFELGPTEDVHLRWAKYADAADEAGISRLWGGIHIRADDRTGRIAGATIGRLAFTKATRIFEGRVSCPADWNADTEVTPADFFTFIADFFTNGAADVNLDDRTNTADFFEFFQSYFGGCP